ncbi:MAG: Ig-like domain-containing protein, partial [Pirellulaceae bacterium]
VGNSVLGTATATGSTTRVATNNFAALGDGTYEVVATQKVGDVGSPSSPGVSIVYDKTVPAVLPTTSFPSSQTVGVALNVNLAHPEEGTGFIYALSNAPTGMTIDPSTGVVQWTPTANQLGTRTFAVSMTDKAGNTRLQDFQITVREVAVGKFELRVVNQQGATVSQLDVGETFNLQIWVQDIRSSDALGVFSAYLDVTYDANLFETVGSAPISHGTVYTNTKSGSVTTAGLIDEVGGVSNSTANLDGEARLLAQVAMRTKAAGEANFSANQADGVGKEFLLYGINEVIDPSQIEYGTRSILVGDSFSVVNDSFSVLEDSQATTLDVLANDNVAASQASQLVVASVSAGSAGGQISVATDGKSVSYRPAANFNGVETFTYAARVGTGATKTATVSVTVQPVNDAPVANPDTFEVLQNAVDFIANVLLNDTTNGDAGENLRVLSTGTPSAGGQVRVAASGLHLLYTPKAGFTGNETVSYTITDGNNLNATSTVTFQVKATVSSPTAVADSFSMNEDEPAKELDVLANDLPSQAGETLTIISATATQGSVAINTSGTRLIYTPKVNFNGVDVVTYTIRGSLGGSATGSATIAIAAVNDGPVAVPDTFTVNASQSSTTLQVLANDLQVDAGETLSISLVTQPSAGQGSVAISSDKRAVIYSPPSSNFAGQVTFTYEVSDGSSLKSSALVTLSVISFVPRSIEGVVVSTINPQTDPLFYLGGQLILQGVDSTNQTVQREGLVRDGLFAFTDVAPGTYTIQPKALPFLSGAIPSLTVVSNQSDGDSKNNELRVGSMDPRFLDIRDFLGTTINRGLTAAVMPGQSQAWVSGRGAWGAYKNVVVSLDAAATQVTVDAIDPTGSQVRATLPANNSQVENRAQQDGFRLLRMPVEPSQLSFAPIAPATQQTTPQGASVPNSTSPAAGEGEPEVGANNWLSTSGISQGNPVSAVSSPAQPASDSSVASSTSAASSPSLAWDYWLGNSADRLKSQAEERAKAADAALQSIGDDDLLPELGGWGRWIG